MTATGNLSILASSIQSPLHPVGISFSLLSGATRQPRTISQTHSDKKTRKRRDLLIFSNTPVNVPFPFLPPTSSADATFVLFALCISSSFSILSESYALLRMAVARSVLGPGGSNMSWLGEWGIREVNLTDRRLIALLALLF